MVFSVVRLTVPSQNPILRPLGPSQTDLSIVTGSHKRSGSNPRPVGFSQLRFRLGSVWNCQTLNRGGDPLTLELVHANGET